MSHFIYCYAECRYGECHYAVCRYIECRYTLCRGAMTYSHLNNRIKSQCIYIIVDELVSRQVSIDEMPCCLD
jgi:hypothetical protein